MTKTFIAVGSAAISVAENRKTGETIAQPAQRDVAQQRMHDLLERRDRKNLVMQWLEKPKASFTLIAKSVQGAAACDRYSRNRSTGSGGRNSAYAASMAKTVASSISQRSHVAGVAIGLCQILDRRFGNLATLLDVGSGKHR